MQIESTPATVLFALGGSDVTGTNLRPDRFKSNGLDGGHAPEVQRLFALLLVGALCWIVALAARARDARHLVLCGFAALLAFVSLGKVFSPQYVIWLAPFAALAWVWGRRAVALLVGAAIVLTHVEFPSRYFDLINEQHGVILVVAARNALLLAALVGARDRARSRGRQAGRAIHRRSAEPLSACTLRCMPSAPRAWVGTTISRELTQAISPVTSGARRAHQRGRCATRRHRHRCLPSTAARPIGHAAVAAVPRGQAPVRRHGLGDRRSACERASGATRGIQFEEARRRRRSDDVTVRR